MFNLTFILMYGVIGIAIGIISSIIIDELTELIIGNEERE